MCPRNHGERTAIPTDHNHKPDTSSQAFDDQQAFDFKLKNGKTEKKKKLQGLVVYSRS